jgi:hypothetical protein
MHRDMVSASARRASAVSSLSTPQVASALNTSIEAAIVATVRRKERMVADSLKEVKPEVTDWACWDKSRACSQQHSIFAFVCIDTLRS